jgi:hypothetical protein
MRFSAKVLWQLTIAFGMMAALIGLGLRYYFVSPLPFNFQYVLHAHSHLMLLGWLFNALLLLIYQQWNIEMPNIEKWLFLGLAFCVLGMLLSFPFQGYALFSITFSTLHLWLSYVLLVKIWKYAKGRGLAGKLVKAGIVFFFISTIGPYSLGPMMANDMHDSPWYTQAIFFYLHFQYNGAFFFFMLAFIVEKSLKPNAHLSSVVFLWLMTLGAVLTWFHTLDFSFNHILINIAGGLGSALQLAAGWLLFKNIATNKFRGFSLLLLAMLGAKLIFQLFGSFPAVADAAVQNRFYLIAWLHFIFLGIFTPFIWENLKIHIGGYPRLMLFYWMFFFATEAVLVVPSLYQVAGFTYWPAITFCLYSGFVVVWLVLGTRAIISLKALQTKV